MGHDVDQTLLRISCVLSVVGSIITMIVCAQIGVIQKRKGRDLIFWLSFADFASSFIYFLSSFESSDDGNNSNLCQTYALLSIFFPVASFLWTDFIAYYLYDMVVNRQNVGEKEWSKLMFSFHIIAWGVSALCITLVGVFRHSGKDSDPDTNNTGGWCWVRADSSRDLFLWELVGGKLVEWSSCLFILPYLYSTTIMRLMQLDNGWDSLMIDDSSISSSHFSGKGEYTSWGSRAAAPFVLCYYSVLRCLHCDHGDTEHDPTLSEGLFHSPEDHYYSESPFQLDNDNLSSHQSGAILKAACPEPDSGSSFENSVVPHASGHGVQKRGSENEHDSPESVSASVATDASLGSLVPPDRSPDLTTATRSSDNSKVLHKPSFRQFYLKMAIVPIIFFICRLWGSVRIIIHFSASSDSPAASASSSWLQTMQAIFDPSLGFFNAVIFVFMSKQDRDAFFNVIFKSKLFNCIRHSAIYSAVFGSFHSIKLKSTQSTSERNMSHKKRVRYQGEDSELSCSDDYDPMDEGYVDSSSYFDMNESSATYNGNTY